MTKPKKHHRPLLRDHCAVCDAPLWVEFLHWTLGLRSDEALAFCANLCEAAECARRAEVSSGWIADRLRKRLAIRAV